MSSNFFVMDEYGNYKPLGTGIMEIPNVTVEDDGKEDMAGFNTAYEMDLEVDEVDKDFARMMKRMARTKKEEAEIRQANKKKFRNKSRLD